MKKICIYTGIKGRNIVAVFTFIFIILSAVLQASGHGGKSHDENAFTSLEALKKATILYDKLIGSQKIDQVWETRLVKVVIEKRRVADKEEIVVAFHRDTGSPDTIYIFFDIDGQYTGSNFGGE